MTPSLPSLRDLTRQLRELHEAFAHPIVGGEYVCLARDNQARRGHFGVMLYVPSGFGREYIPGDGAPFDAVGAARRLLAAARDASDTAARDER